MHGEGEIGFYLNCGRFQRMRFGLVKSAGDAPAFHNHAFAEFL
jgi:hypothetical protein